MTPGTSRTADRRATTPIVATSTVDATTLAALVAITSSRAPDLSIRSCPK